MLAAQAINVDFYCAGVSDLYTWDEIIEIPLMVRLVHVWRACLYYKYASIKTALSLKLKSKDISDSEYTQNSENWSL